MHQAVGVGGVEGARELRDHVDGPFWRQRAVPPEEVAQVVALDETHVEVEPAVDGAEVVDRDDVRLVQLRDQRRLAAEPRLERRVVGEVRDEALERDETVTHRVVRAEDLAHPATPEPLQQLVGPEGLHG